ncbi:hypothetical protein WJX81_008589 [Elliptochloris bilobata]|uniref:SET domain-containing protein n=1 Tax=Elliptochloris bilobata TaxID=381761 RepID=A0AAW1QMG1_9CHLO
MDFLFDALIRASNGTADVTVGSVPGSDGLRGVLADREFAAGETVISVPFQLAVQVGFANHSAQELALRLLRRRASQPEWWAAHASYWESLPPIRRVYTKECWRPEHLALLQDTALEQYISANTLKTTAAYHGALEESPGLPPLSVANVSLAEFRHWAALISSYSFLFPSADGSAKRYLLPLADLMNHNGTAPGVQIVKSPRAGAFLATALRNISAGEQVTHRYSFALERPDYAIANYFFTQRLDDPPRAALDLPAHDLEANFEDASDAHFEPREGIEAQVEARRLANQLAAFPTVEARRLANQLAAFPTSQAQDAEQLTRGVDDAGAPLDWRVRRIVEFRVQRKRALRRAIRRLHRPRGRADHPVHMRRRHGQDGVTDLHGDTRDEDLGDLLT